MVRKADDLRAEYKLSDFRTKGVRGKHLKRYRAGTSMKREQIKRPEAARKERPSRQQRFRNYVHKKRHR